MNKITQIILDGAPANTSIAQIKLMAAKLAALVDEAVNHKDRELKDMWDKWPEPVNYVSSDGLLLLPDNIRDKLNLRQGGGVSFVPNKETGRFELWTMDEVDKWFSGEGEPDDQSTATKEQCNENDPMLYSEKSGWHKANSAPSYDINSINGVEVDSTKKHMTVVAMADGLYRAENGKLTKMESKPDEQPKTEERMKLSVNDDGTFSWSKVQVPISEDYDNQELWGLSRDEVNACASAPYEWACASEQDDDFMPNDKPPLNPPSEESLKAMADLGIDINATQQRPMTICYGNGMDDMFIRYDDERNHWVLYNWRGVDGRDKWLEEVRVRCEIWEVVSDDFKWIWRNGERERREVS